MKDLEKLEEELKKFICENFILDSIDNSTLFIEEGIVDSSGIIEIVSFLEENYDITAEDDEFTESNFSSIDSIINFVQSKI